MFYGNIKKMSQNINPYLLDYPNLIVIGRSKPISKFPEMNFGSMPNDKGFLLLNEQEKNDLISQNREISPFIKKFSGGEEFVKGINRYCLWIEEQELEKALNIPLIAERVEKVKEHRQNSKREVTQELADIPYRTFFRK